MEEEKKEHKKISLSKKLKENPWVLSTLVFGVLVVLLIISNFAFTGNVSKEKVASNFISYINSVSGAQLEYSSVDDYGNGFYQVIVEVSGQQVPVYITKDGKYYTTSLVPITQEENTNTNSQTEEVPKTDKPIVELFVWGYCPYGVQAQGPLTEVAKLLGANADFEIVPYYDGHGAFETQENKIELCIQKISPEKYWDYSAGFVENIYSKCSQERTESCDLTEATSLMNSLGIDSSAVLECVNSEGDVLFEEARQKASSYGVTGSPTLVINGVKINNIERTAEAFKDAVCSAFSEGNVPEECSQTLNSEQTTTGGSC